MLEIFVAHSSGVTGFIPVIAVFIAYNSYSLKHLKLIDPIYG